LHTCEVPWQLRKAARWLKNSPKGIHAIAGARISHYMRIKTKAAYEAATAAFLAELLLAYSSDRRNHWLSFSLD
jgi:hypothetical protein